MKGLPSGASRVAGVVGRPIAHSLSPALHRAWLDAAGIDGLYAPFSPPEDGFAAFVEGVRRSGVVGLNVTLPFKMEALALADHADAAATAAGAANLLLFGPDGLIEARNTDGIGFLAALRDGAPDLDLSAAPAVVLGAGGAARGAVAALLSVGVPMVTVVNRTASRAQMLAAEVGDRVAAAGLGTPEAALALGCAGVIVNGTSAAQGDGGLEFDFAATTPGAVAMDMTYRPLSTPFLIAAARAGRRTADGLSMLIHQAAPSFEAFYGAPPPPIDGRGLLIGIMERGG